MPYPLAMRQPPLSDRDLATPWDAAVVGAGPAGAVAARELARRGHAVLLLDRKAFPREKVCGEALIADSLRCLDRLGLLAAVRARAHAVDELAAFSPAGVEVRLPSASLTLERRVFDALLAGAAAEAGARFAQAAVTALAERDGGVDLHVAGAAAPLRARVVVLATGADVSLLGAAGLLARRRASAAALRCHVASPCDLPRLVISYDRSIVPGYGWIFPLGNGRYNVGCGCFFGARAAADVNLRTLFHTFAARFAPARALMDAATEIGPLRGAALRCGLAGARPWSGGRVVAVGEALGTTFPFTGEGIGKAMESAELAAPLVDAALRADDPAALAGCATALATLERRYTGYRVAERWLGSPWINDLVARRVRRSPFLREAATALLDERADPRVIFSVTGLLKSLWA